MSVPFVANDGQADKQVAFLARTFAGTVFVTRDGRLVYSLRGSGAHATPSSAPHPAGWAISESFEGLSAAPIGLGERGNMVSDFVATAGSRPRHSASPTFERVGLGEIAPGITVEVRATGNNVEKLFTLAPGADAEHLRVRIDGATGLALAADGSLSVGTGLGNLTFTAPLAYQEQNGARQTVTAAYRIGATPGLYGFALGAYDRSLPLIIDPLIRSTYSGGNATDTIRAMLVHPGSGEVYVAGSTTSTTFPSIAGPITTNVVGTDMFVARYAAGLNSLQRVTFYGGAGDDSANAIGILPSSGD
ncbi:MAG: hypothetical protein ABIS68_01390, partial [Casimicrobiaceae bacterium]